MIPSGAVGGPAGTDPVEAAERAFLGGRTQDAVSMLFQAMNLDPLNARVNLALGVILHSLGQLEAARQSFARALELDEDDPAARRNLALALFSLKDHDSARRELETLMVRRPNDPQYWSALSAVEDAIGRAAPGTPARRSVFMKPAEDDRPGGDDADSGRLDPDRVMQDDMIRRLADRDRKTLAVFLTMTSGPEMNVLSAWLGDYFDVRNVMSFKYDVYREAARDADIVWLEGLSDGNVHFLEERDLPEGKKVALRLSREDVLAGAARRVAYGRADAIFLESFCLRDLFLAGNPDVRGKTPIHVILKAVDTRVYAYIPRHGHRRIAAVIPERFDPSEFVLLLEAYLALRSARPEAELHLSVGLRNMANEYQVQQFLSENGCGYSVFFHGHGEELKPFLNSCHCFLSAEAYAGGPGALEALLLGLKPLIRSSPGAAELYPERCLWRNLGELAALYENPPDTVRISEVLKAIHRPAAVAPQYIQRFIAMGWF
ncbi:MAG: tetratricopeptide repeat protein [Deltaproteobacteria bacterium]|jgi:tetratricopeptide (TPR) repeat protein|nr:tetratricopeptide repeat protein [Deltaproteobacteria bacterium]